MSLLKYWYRFGKGPLVQSSDPNFRRSRDNHDADTRGGRVIGVPGKQPSERVPPRIYSSHT